MKNKKSIQEHAVIVGIGLEGSRKKKRKSSES